MLSSETQPPSVIDQMNERVSQRQEEALKKDIEGLKDSSKYEGMYETPEIDALKQAIHIIERLDVHNYVKDQLSNPIKHEKLKGAKEYLEGLLKEAQDKLQKDKTARAQGQTEVKE